MKKFAVPVQAMIFGFLIGVITLFIFTQEKQITDTSLNIPSSVEQQYTEAVTDFGAGIGTTLSSCDSESGKVYVVQGSSGFLTASYYYEYDGTYLGHTQMSDMVDDPQNKLDTPVEVDLDSCKQLKPEPSDQTPSTELQP